MNDMHRAVHIQSGRIVEVSTHIAKQPKLMAEYGYILQDLPKEDINQLESQIREVAKKSIEENTNEAIEKALTVVEDKPKRSYNKQNK